MRNIKSLIVKATMTGRGVVQFDGVGQDYAHNISKGTLVKSGSIIGTSTFAKASYSSTAKDADGKDIILRTIKISGDGLRHAIHVEEHPFHTPNIAHSDLHKVVFLADLGTLQRGYLITDTGERKKSSYCVTSAKEVSGSIPTLEQHARSGAKEKAKNEGDSKDTTAFGRESIGDTKYEFTLLIDLSELGMISLSDLQDRRALVDSLVPLFRERLSANLGSQVPEAFHFIKKGCAYSIPERGILLNQDQVRVMAVNLLQKIASVFISKSQTGYAKVTDVHIKAIVDPLTDTDDGMGFVTVKDATKSFDKEVIEAYLESFQQSYLVVPEDVARAELMEYNDKVAEAKKATADAKKAKKSTAASTKKKAKGAADGEAEATEEDAE